MSAFLGPIHFWLYKKILTQDAMTSAIIASAESCCHLPALSADTAAACGSLESGPLESLIDEGNIHGWLQERVSLVERRLAFAVNRILESSKDNLDHILKAAYDYGCSMKAEMGLTPEEAYRFLDSILLNGMPCDHVNRISQADTEHLIWCRMTEIHESYWQEAGLDVSYYYMIRGSFTKGIFDGTDMIYSEPDTGKYMLKKA